MKIKVCGLKYPENIQAVCELNPDFIGLIFYEKSPRFFSGLLPQIPENIATVGVFVDASESYIRSISAKYNLKAIQFHGSETPEFVSEFASDFITIKAFAIDGNFDFSVLSDYENNVDYFLFDTKGANPGGNGTAFDWNLLKNLKTDTPYFLSGGISIDDIDTIKNSGLQPFGLDLNSRFEDEPGLKNIPKLQHFISCFK